MKNKRIKMKEEGEDAIQNLKEKEMKR